MTSLLLYCAVGVGLIVLVLLVLLRRPSHPEGSAEALLGAKHALRALQLELLPPELVERFFARSDFEYVLSSAPAAIHRQFLEERKRIALSWVNQVRQQLKSLQDFHFGHSRHFVRLSLSSEIGFACEFVILRMECRALNLLFYLRGPYRAPRLAAKLAAAAAQLCATSEISLAFLNAAESRVIADDSARGSAMV